MIVSEILFLPWLGMNAESEAAGVRFIPKDQYLSGLCQREREWLEKYFAQYRRSDGSTPADTICVAAGVDFSKAVGAIRAVAAALLVWKLLESLRGGNATVPPPRAERWVFFAQRLDPTSNHVAVHEGYTTAVFQLGGFVEVEPLQSGMEVFRLEDAVRSMAGELLAEAACDEDFAAALELLVEGAMTTTRHIRRLNFILAGSALELLSGASGHGPKASRIADALACAVRRAQRGCPSEHHPLARLATRARETNADVVRIWIEGCRDCNSGRCSRHASKYNGFYRKRNKVIHQGAAGGDLLIHHRPDDGQPHRWPIGSGGAHAVDVALAMAGWLLLDRVGSRLQPEIWGLWCNTLDEASAALGMK